jgi:hypothetical protein
MAQANRRPVNVTPSARRLTGSLRDIGYDFVAAVADVVDNSVTAGASTVEIEMVFDGADSFVVIADDGCGMTEAELVESLRFGSRSDYGVGDLGRYGLGLKTASLSQGRRVTVVARRALNLRRLSAKSLDLDHIDRTDRWQIIEPPVDSPSFRALEWLSEGPGTVVFWEKLDRVLPMDRPDGGWARRRLDQLAVKAREYLGMVFHRFIEGDVDRDGGPLTITVNGEKARAWNPFSPLEEHRVELPAQSYEIASGDLYGRVVLNRYVLPPKDKYSSHAEFERMSGPRRWNRQQGLYIYRANRLIQHGGWCGIRAADEHTKFARASLDIQTDLDALFRINVAKMRVSLPPEIRTLLERPIHELCHRADSVYRRDADRSSRRPRREEPSEQPETRRVDLSEVGTSLIAAALEAGEHDAFVRVMDRLRGFAPDLSEALGW